MARGVDLRVHLVTDDRLPFDHLLRVVDAAVRAGVGVVQLRDKRVSARVLLERTAAVARVVAGRAALVVDDRLDVVLAARCADVRVDGVHLGQDDVPPTVARRLLGPDALVGWTAHAPEHLAAVARMPAGTVDYLGTGVVRATGTKTDHPPELGVLGVGAVAAATSLPVVAIGGIDLDDVVPLRRAGVAGVAVVSALCAAPDPGAAARDLVDRSRT